MDYKLVLEKIRSEYGVKVVRFKGRLHYRLPTGEKVPVGGAGGGKGDVSMLCKRLKIDVDELQKEKQPMNQPAAIAAPPKVQQTEKPTQLPQVVLDSLTHGAPTLSGATIAERLEELIRSEQSRYDLLMQQAVEAEKRRTLYESFRPFAGDPNTEDALRLLLPPPPTPPPTPPPPQKIENTLQVTRELVYAATQTFDANELFEVNDIVKRMTRGEMSLSDVEFGRVRMAVAAMLKTLESRGMAKMVEQGRGRRPAKWAKIMGTVTNGEWGHKSDQVVSAPQNRQ